MFQLDADTYIKVIDWLARLPVIFFALTVHEFAHAWMAVRCGDPTPEQQGRVTLNPLAHLDPVGTLMILFGPVGWGRPVQVNPYNFRNPRKDELLVSAAGPLSNIFQAVIFSMLFAVFNALGADMLQTQGTLSLFLQRVCIYGVIINLALAIFNMIPLFPLDGEKVLVQSLPPAKSYKLIEFRRTSTMVLMGLLLLGFVTPINIIGWWLDILMAPFLWILNHLSSLLGALLSSLLM